MIKLIDCFYIGPFQDFECEFGKGINVLIGDNGNGKTHLLKYLYYGCEIDEAKFDKGGQMDFSQFMGASPIDMINNGYGTHLDRQPEVYVLFGDETNSRALYVLPKTPVSMPDGKKYEVGNTGMFINVPAERAHSSVFIPDKDMLSHSRGLVTMAKKFGTSFPFSYPYLSIIEKAQAWKLSTVPKYAEGVESLLTGQLGGSVVVDDDVFYILHNDGTRTRFSLEAEGTKKFALLWTLLMNESIVPGTVLFWDEPDAYLNPKHIPLFVKILLMLQKRGVQIFISTHSYLLAKYFDICRDADSEINFISLYRSESDVLLCETADSFESLKNNEITKAFNDLLNRVYAGIMS